MGDRESRRARGRFAREGRGHSQEASSSEYSSSHSQENSDASSPYPISPHQPNTNDPETYGELATSSHADRARDYARTLARQNRSPAPVNNSVPPSDEEEPEYAQNSAMLAYGQRGKKGLSRAEMALLGQNNAERYSTGEETEDDEEDQVPQTKESGGSGHESVSDDTEDESEDCENRNSSHGLKVRIGRRRSQWSQFPRIVSEVAQILEARGVEPSELGYARLSGAGKGVVDYLVRKQSVLIGRQQSAVDCHVKSETKSISKRHARLYWIQEREEWVIECVSRKNSVVVNGIPVIPGSAPMPVKSRDLIELGDVAFFFLAAMSPIFLVSDIPELEKTIRFLEKTAHDEKIDVARERGRDDDRHYAGGHGARNDSKRKKSKNERSSDRKRGSDDSRMKFRHESDRPGRPRPRKQAKIDSNETFCRGEEEEKGYEEKASTGYASRRTRKRGSSSQQRNVNAAVDPDETEDEREEEVKRAKLKLNRNIREHVTSSPFKAPLISNYNIRARTARDEVTPESKKFTEEWNKKERGDFGRALFAVGVDPVPAEDGSTDHYDWKRFRKIAELPKKSDLMLEDYYIRLMNDVRSLLEEEEREKRTKGPRTKHKPGCDCVVCENTRKSRRKKREQLEHSNRNNADDSEGADDAEVKSTAKSSDKLVGLVTAQKLRARLAIHEAARNVKSGAGDTVFQKLDLQKSTLVRDFPEWWRPGYHDKALMRGTGIHGVGQWNDIWNDPRIKPFRKMKDQMGSSVVWPTNQAAMKRLRELSSAINAELRKEAKRVARGGSQSKPRVTNSDSATGRKARSASTGTLRGSQDSKIGRRGNAKSSSAKSPGFDYETAYPSQAEAHEIEVSSLAEESDNDVQGNEASPIELEDEDEVEVEVEEEMEIVEEEEDQEMSDHGGDGVVARGSVAGKHVASSVADVSTDDEDDEDNIQYETASDTGTD